MSAATRVVAAAAAFVTFTRSFAMSYRRIIQSEPGLINFTGNIDQLLTLDASRYGVSEDVAGAYSAARLRFMGAYSTYNSDLTHSKPYRVAKDAAKLALVNATADIVEQVYANKTLTDEIRQELGLSPRERRGTPAPVATEAPVVMGEVAGPTSVRIMGRDAESPSRRGKPAGMRQLAVATIFADEQPGPGAAWSQAILSGRTTVLLKYPRLEQAAVLWVSCWWVNSRSEPGPMSVPVCVRLSGTGAGMPVREREDVNGGMKIAA